MVLIAHASVPTAEQLSCFEHAVALAERAQGKLLSLHANDDPAVVAQMPDAADTLRRWGHQGAAVDHEKMVHNCCEDPVDTLLDALRQAEPDLVVAGTHQRKGMVRVFIESRAEVIAENVKVPTLLLPLEGRRFVSVRGEVDLRRLLVPVGDAVAAAIAIERACWFVDLLRADDVEVELLYVGAEGGEPELVIPSHPRIRFVRETVAGSLEDVVVERAKEASAIVMATRGHDSIGDMVRGSHTERVLRRVQCPVLSVPMPA